MTFVGKRVAFRYAHQRCLYGITNLLLFVVVLFSCYGKVFTLSGHVVEGVSVQVSLVAILHHNKCAFYRN